MKRGLVTLAVACALTGVFAPSASAQNQFCLAGESIVATVTDPALAPILALLGDDLAFLEDFACDVADINGPGDLENLVLVGNGVLDFEFELGVLAEVVTNPGLYDGLPVAGTTAAGIFTTNQSIFAAELQGLDDLISALDTIVQGDELTAGLLLDLLNGFLPDGTPDLTLEELQAAVAGADTLFPDIAFLLSGYDSLDDPATQALIDGLVAVVNELLADDLVATLAGAIGTFAGTTITLDPIDLSGVAVVPGVALSEDADGDGFTQQQELDPFAADIAAAQSGKALNPALTNVAGNYVSAALDPSQTPGPVGPMPTDPPAISLSANAQFYEVGDTLILSANGVPTSDGVSFQNVVISYAVDGMAIPDESGPSLTIAPLTEADSGSYTVTVAGELEDGTKAFVPFSVTSAPVVVNVLPAGSLPVGGGLVLGAIAAACALGGALSIRRK